MYGIGLTFFLFFVRRPGILFFTFFNKLRVIGSFFESTARLIFFKTRNYCTKNSKKKLVFCNILIYQKLASQILGLGLKPKKRICGADFR